MLLYKIMAKLVGIAPTNLKFGSRLVVGCFGAKVERKEMMAQVNLIVYSALWSLVHFDLVFYS